MKQNKKKLAPMSKRMRYMFGVLLLTFSTLLPILNSQHASAYTLMIPRSIKMSNSIKGDDASGLGDNVAYEVSFTLASQHDVRSISIDFCQNSPIIGTEACLTPAGFDFDTHKDTVTLNGVTGLDGTLAIDTALSDANTIILTRTGGTTPVNASTAVSFTFGNGTNNGFRNPDDTDGNSGNGDQVGSFYARIRTFTSANATGTEVDAGGIALSTASSVTITSKVTERLVFCVYTGALCSGGTTGLVLGDDNGVLSPSGTFVNKDTKFDILTNASQGVNIRVKGDTLKTGSFSINPIGATAAQVNGANVGTEQFGFCMYRDSGATGLASAVPYGGGAGGTANTACNNTVDTAGTASPGGDNAAYFAFDTNTTDGTMSTYGDIFATKTAGDFSTGVLAFAANIANTTEAGIYNTTLYFIATGSF